MNLVETYIGEIWQVSEKVDERTGKKYIAVLMETNCWGEKKVRERLYNSMEEWEAEKAKGYFLE